MHLSNVPFRADIPHAFMIVPFHQKHDGIQQAIRRAAASVGLAAFRTDDVRRSTPILERTLKGIESATVVVADLTDGRPNCYYELGYADALKRPVVVVSHLKEIPEFDVAARSICRYDDAADLELSLPHWLVEEAMVNRVPASEVDSNAGRFGRMALVDGLLLSAHMRVDPPDEDGDVWCRVFATLRRVDGKPIAEDAKVTFHLDKHSWKKPRRRGAIVNGIAELSFDCYGAFTLGASVGSTSLELDLRHIPGATDLFRSL